MIGKNLINAGVIQQVYRVILQVIIFHTGEGIGIGGQGGRNAGIIAQFLCQSGRKGERQQKGQQAAPQAQQGVHKAFVQPVSNADGQNGQNGDDNEKLY